MEVTQFDWIVCTSVNDYFAKKAGEYIDGKFYPSSDYKAKGDFEYEKLLNKNTSFSIIPLALQEHYKNNVDVEEFINCHNNIYDFFARSSQGKSYIHKGFDKNGNELKLPKFFRYYVAKEGVMMKKEAIKEITNASNTSVQPADKPKVMLNRVSDVEYHLSNIDRKWYINKVKSLILSIQNGKKMDYIEDNSPTLF